MKVATGSSSLATGRSKGDRPTETEKLSNIASVADMVLGRYSVEEQLRFQEWVFDDLCTVPIDVRVTGAVGVSPLRPAYVTNHVPLSHSALPAELYRTLEEVRHLRYLPPGWNGYDIAAPNPDAIRNAASWIQDMHEDISHIAGEWHAPHVAADENGDVTFEWWNGDKGLTVYVYASGNVSYLKDWGPDIIEDMEDGPVSTSEERRALWSWFTS